MSAHGGPPSVAELARGAAALACVIAARLALERFGHHLDHAHGGAGPLFSLGFLIIAGHVCGGIAAFVRLPRLTGYLLAGLAAGPQGAGFLDAHDVKALTLVNTLALALIALQAGAEITLPVLRRTWMSVGASALAQIAIVIPGMALVFWALSPVVPFTADLAPGALLAVALLWGTLAFTRSPTVTLAVLGETRARGPLADWSIGIVVVLDVLILPLFATVLGVARSHLRDAALDEMVARIQRDLFALGARLADPAHRIADRVAKATLGPEDVTRLEGWIDELETGLPPLRRFILAGGTPAGATLHLARTVCRRAERRSVALGQAAVEPAILAYMNRLSDLLFVMARAANQRAGVPEQEW